MDHIRRRTRKNSVYYTDAFREYQSLPRYSEHHIISHRKNVVDPRTKNHYLQFSCEHALVAQ